MNRFYNLPSNEGTGFFNLLTIVLIVLKLCHVIDWSWWWVLAPVWGSIVFLFLLVLIFSVYKIVAHTRKDNK